MTHMRRRTGRWPALAALAAGAVAVTLTLASGPGTPPYRVRAVFDSAANVIPGEDVKIAGVTVGAVDGMHVVDDRHAALVLRIDDPAFRDFRRDARCEIRLQSLIGEKFVDCTPTEPRDAAAATAPPPPLAVIPAGRPGAGERYLPLARTASPVDPDLVQDVACMPAPQRLRVILDELGTGLGARGQDLHDTIRRADPALRETDRVLAVLASQQHRLDRLAVASAAALAPVARQSRHVSGAIRSIGATAAATAEQRGALAQDLRRFPRLLAELRPTTDRLGQLADAVTPVLGTLDGAAPGLNAFATGLGPFARAAVPWLDSLGRAARTGTPDLVAARPAVHALAELATGAGPQARQLDRLLRSLEANRGIESFMRLTFFGASATNGHDSISHYLRTSAHAIAGCTFYAVVPATCSGNFAAPSAARSTPRAAAPAAPGRPDRALLDYLLAP